METCHGPEERRADKGALAALAGLGAPCCGLCLMPPHAALMLFQREIRKMLRPRKRARPQPGRHALTAGGLWRKTEDMAPERLAAGTLSPMRNSRAWAASCCPRRCVCFRPPAAASLPAGSRAVFCLFPGRSAATGPHGVLPHEPNRACIFTAGVFPCRFKPAFRTMLRPCGSRPLASPQHADAARIRARHGQGRAKETSRSSFFDGVACG